MHKTCDVELLVELLVPGNSCETKAMIFISSVNEDPTSLFFLEIFFLGGGVLGDVTKAEQIKRLTLKVLVTTIDAQWEGMGDVGSARYEPALLPPCPTIRVVSYSN